MKIKKFTPENTPSTSRRGVVQISFNRSGLISISPALSEQMELDENSCISIMQDEESPEDWFVAKDADGFALRANANAKGYNFNSAGLVSAVLDGTVGPKVRIASFKVSEKINEDAGGYFMQTAAPLKTQD